LLESKECPAALKTAIKFEAPLNLRNSATVAGTLVAGDGRSTFITALLALDARVDHRPLATEGDRSSVVHGLGEYLLTRPRALITSIIIPIHVKFAFESVSRTPADKPIICVALAQWNSGRTRLALGGYGKTPLLAMDGTEADGFDTAARNAYHEAGDEWASAEYRMDIAATLAKRCLEAIK
jgi:CO/xanthine dehydrogenase FAD-binding subunit